MPLKLMRPGIFNCVCYVSTGALFGLIAMGFIEYGWKTALIGAGVGFIGGSIHSRIYGVFFTVFAFVYAAVGLGLGVYVYSSFS